MPHPRVRLAPTDADIPGEVLQALEARFAAVRDELGLSLDYPADALAEAEQVAAAPPALPERDETALPFFTVDPPGSMDLDQAMHLERDGDGHRIRYAIADVPTFVRLGGALDRVTRERGQTVYCPDVRVPLHPEVLSRGRRQPAAGCRAPRLRLGPAPRRRGRCSRRRRCTARWCAASSGSTTRTCRRRSTPAPTTSASCCSRRSASAASPRSGPAAARACRCPSSR